jgi:hypothetical protein
MFGLFEIRKNKKDNVNRIYTTSLLVNFLWNSILSVDSISPSGFEDPFSCREKMCTNTIKIITKGRTK